LAGGQTVVALGTGFNVRAYTDESDIKVALVEGSVSVMNDQTGQAVVLKPAQGVTILKKTGTIAVNDVDLDETMAWKTGQYVFCDMRFDEIVKMLEKGFKVTIHIENEALKNKPYTMRFENGESLEKILDLIQVNAQYSYHYHNGVIIIK
jgi:ferric-dicitrate binding protein FerR (iron transport regulator)